MFFPSGLAASETAPERPFPAAHAEARAASPTQACFPSRNARLPSELRLCAETADGPPPSHVTYAFLPSAVSAMLVGPNRLSLSLQPAKVKPMQPSAFSLPP